MSDKTTREEVYKLIDGERDYQDTKSLTGEKVQEVSAELIMMDSYLRRAFDGFTDRKGDAAALDQIRKVAALAVRCMENHKTAPRFMTF